MLLSSGTKRLLLLLFFGGAPLAYLLSAVLIVRYDPNTHLDFQYDRRQTIKRAAQYAATLGINVGEWSSGCVARTNNDRFFYYRGHLKQEDSVKMARRLAPEAYVQVRFVSPDNKEKLDISLTPDGRPLGYARTLDAKEETIDRGIEADRALATAAYQSFARDVGIDAADQSPPEESEDRRYASVIRTFSYRLGVPALPELELRRSVKVLGDRIIAEEVTGDVDPAYAKANLVNHFTSLKVLGALYAITLFSLSIYALFRYVQRTRQKEVPHVRSLALSAFSAVIFMLFALQTDFQIFEIKGDEASRAIVWLILIFSGIVFTAMGLVFGIAYGSGEGGIRESYPGKLASLDALITGHVLSRNVARALCIGFTMGGWVLLLRTLVWLPWALRPDALGLAERTYSILFGSLVLAIPFLTATYHGIIVSVFGLLLPLSLLQRRVRSKKLFYGLLIALSLCVAFESVQDKPLPLAPALLQAGVMMAGVLVPFFLCDLLTAICCSAAPTLMAYVIYLISQPAASFHRAGYLTIGLTILLIAIEAYFAVNGRDYQEDEVRPRYAKLLAERLGMQAEVSAAREAQIRLLPQKLPQLAEVSVAAACRPAHVVGGDFYDLFMIDLDRIGIFIAEGNGRGLEAAMTIAFAKGFLMPRVGGGHSPGELICHLQSHLLPLLGKDEELMAAYATINTATRTFDYARTGTHPQVMWLGGDQSEEGKIALRHHDERILTETTTPDPRCHVYEGRLNLSAGDSVLLVTDRLAHRLKAEARGGVARFVEKITGAHKIKVQFNETLQQTLVANLETLAKRTKKTETDDDLTAVLIHFRPANEDAGHHGGAALPLTT